MYGIKIEVTGNIARVIEKPKKITSGTVGLPVEVSFDSQWDGLSKTIVFQAGCVCKVVDVTPTEMVVPWEVLEKPGNWLCIGAYGANKDNTIAIPTTWANVCVINIGTNPDGDPTTDPSLPAWAQMRAEFEELKDLNGIPGPAGPKGDPGKDGYTPVKGVDYFDGDPGKDGYTPVRGTDYWTEEDIAEIKRYVDDQNAPHGPTEAHNYVTVSIKTPTCTEAGLVAGVCRCGDAYAAEVPAFGHDFVDGICAVCTAADPNVFSNGSGYYNAKFVKQTGYYNAGALTQGDFYYNTGLMAMGKASKLYFKWYDVGTQYVTYFDANGNYLSQTTGLWSGGRKIFTAPAAAEYVAVSYLDEENEGAWVMFNAHDERHTIDNQLAPTAGNITNVIHGTAYKCLGLEAVTSVTMGGEDITAQVYDSTLGSVIIPSVTGDVVIQ
jgi:hypothetical protein